MDLFQIFIVIASFLGVLGFAVMAYTFLGGSKGQTTELRELMSSSKIADEETINQVKKISKKSKKKKKKKNENDLSVRLFKAGYFTASDRDWFLKFRIKAFVICIVAFPLIAYYATANMKLSILCIAIGGLGGFVVPSFWLDKEIKRREDDVMYFLPLVIEQVSIGVSSSLDVGPCLTNIVEMAEERDSHNAVTEMIAHTSKLMRSGLSLEDALVEVADANGSMEVKHAFMFLAQCSKHGGEVSKQLQELADSVMMQRQVQVEAKITQLPVKATGPLAFVFKGYFALLFSGIAVRLMSAFG